MSDVKENAQTTSHAQEEVNFGYQKVSPEEKTKRVGEVFKAVADRYDVMNDLMSFGTHRIFKRMVLQMSGARAGHNILDLSLIHI